MWLFMWFVLVEGLLADDDVVADSFVKSNISLPGYVKPTVLQPELR